MISFALVFMIAHERGRSSKCDERVNRQVVEQRTSWRLRLISELPNLIDNLLVTITSYLSLFYRYYKFYMKNISAYILATKKKENESKHPILHSLSNFVGFFIQHIYIYIHTHTHTHILYICMCCLKKQIYIFLVIYTSTTYTHRCLINRRS